MRVASRSLILTAALAVAVALPLLPSAGRLLAAPEPPDPMEKEFAELMDAANQLNGKLGYFLKEKDGAESASAAKEMQAVFVKIREFWEKKKSATGIKYATGAVDGFQKTQQFAAAGKLPEALQAYYDARANCEGCHKDHRVRDANGNWQIKY